MSHVGPMFAESRNELRNFIAQGWEDRLYIGDKDGKIGVEDKMYKRDKDGRIGVENRLNIGYTIKEE